MRYPRFLKKNDTIGFVAPSFGCNMEPYKSAFENALEKFKAMGYGVMLGPNCYKSDGIGISSTPKNCADEMNEFYASDENDCLISCGGGELMCETIDYIDFEKIKQEEPKWYMGYSDNTNMTFLLATLTDTASIYGPCAGAFGMRQWHPAIEDAFGILTGEVTEVKNYDKWEKDSLKNADNPLEPYNVTEEFRVKKYIGDKSLLEEQTVSFEGRLIGGCLDCLANLVGTKYDKVEEFANRYKDDGIIWFLEACDLNMFSIRRAMWQLDRSGWFKYTKGFIIGRPYHHGEEMMGLDQYQAVLKIIEKYNVPVIMDADIGHLSPMMPLVVGSMAEVKSEGNTLSINMKYE